MTSLGKATIEEMSEFHRRLAKAGLTAEQLGQVNTSDDLAAAMVQGFQTRQTGLLHGRFLPLVDKLALVRTWPGVTEEAIQAALQEGAERIIKFQQTSLVQPLLDIVICVYREDAQATLLFALNRLREAFNLDSVSGIDDRFWYQPRRIAYRTEITAPSNQVCLEVVDLGAKFDPVIGFVPERTCGIKSAHAAVFYAAVQNKVWLQQMVQGLVPTAMAGGFRVFNSNESPVICWPWIDQETGEPLIQFSSARSRYYHLSIPSFCL